MTGNYRSPAVICSPECNFSSELTLQLSFMDFEYSFLHNFALEHLLFRTLAGGYTFLLTFVNKVFSEGKVIDYLEHLIAEHIL